MRCILTQLSLLSPSKCRNFKWPNQNIKPQIFTPCSVGYSNLSSKIDRREYCSSSIAEAKAMASTKIVSDPESISYLNQREAAEIDEILMGPLGFSVDQLMELAGLSVATSIAEVYKPAEHKRVLAICGPGNNGGDGLVAARHLHHFGYEPSICYPKRTAKALYHGLVTQLESLSVPFLSVEDLPVDFSSSFDVVVDAIFGFSFQGSPRPPFDDLIQRLLALGSPNKRNQKPAIVSVDIPSGWHVEEGDLSGEGIKPDMLVSLTAPKLCAKRFSGSHHFLGGRFVPPAIAENFKLHVPAYPGTSMCVRIGKPPRVDISALRENYVSPEFSEDQVEADPFAQFQKWFDDAMAAGLKEPNAMALSTAGKDGKISSRMVLLKGLDKDGFVWYTNYESQKAHQLSENPQAALLFYWDGLNRQVYKPSEYNRVLVICGPGNNGGDGLVAARHLHHFGCRPCICYPKRTSKRLYEGLVTQLDSLSVPFISTDTLAVELLNFDIIVDAIFGFSFQGYPRPPFDDLIHSIASFGKHNWGHQKSPVIVSVDIPSGWHVEDGDISGEGLKPDMLVSLTAPKLCAKGFHGPYHFLGGRFVPPSIISKYNLQLPPYPGTSMCVQIGKMIEINIEDPVPPRPIEKSMDGDPFVQFQKWFDDAVAAGLKEPNAMALSTASKDGKPSSRMVSLMKVDKGGFVWCSNYGSRKGREISENPHAALLFYWNALNRQVRVEGFVEKVSDEESEQYFCSIPRELQIAPSVSQQSTVVQERGVLLQQCKELEEKYPEGNMIPMPQNWGGYRLIPKHFEFWQGDESSVHFRLRYYAQDNNGKKEWRIS